jgi:hypothetical protein
MSTSLDGDLSVGVGWTEAARSSICGWEEVSEMRAWLWFVFVAASAGNIFGAVWLALWVFREWTNAVMIPTMIAPLVVIIAAVTGSVIQLAFTWKRVLRASANGDGAKSRNM